LVISQVLEDLSELFLQRNQDIDLEMPYDSVIVFGNELRLRQVVVNLVNNASKSGGVLDQGQGKGL